MNKPKEAESRHTPGGHYAWAWVEVNGPGHPNAVNATLEEKEQHGGLYDIILRRVRLERQGVWIPSRAQGQEGAQ